jgi:hypothetical protein
MLSDIAIRRDLNGESKTDTIGLLIANTFHADNCFVKNVSINGNHFNVQLGTATTQTGAFTLWENCEFGNYDQYDQYGIYAINAIEQKFVACRIMGFDEIGFYVPSAPTSISVNDFVFVNCYFGSVSYSFGGNGADYCVRIRAGFAMFFNNCIFE